MTTRAGMHSLGVAFPRRVVTNAHWRRHHPQMVEKAERSSLARLWAQDGPPTDPFDVAMAAYADDPFKGSVERRVLSDGESSLSLELDAARQALSAARLDATDIDLIIVSSFRPDTVGVGNAAFLARELGVKIPAVNLETACSSSVFAFHTACGLIQGGLYRRILCVVSCTYSRDIDETDSLAWFLGDGAGAFVVGPVADDLGLEGFHTEATTDTCNTWSFELEIDEDRPRVHMRSNPDTGRILRASSTHYIRSCVGRALERAGTTLDQVDYFVFNTPTAWFREFAERALEIPPGRALSTYPRYSNIGPALMPANLHQAAHDGLIQPGSRIVLYSVGSVSTASAAVLRWGDVSLGALPPRAPQDGAPPPLG